MIAIGVDHGETQQVWTWSGYALLWLAVVTSPYLPRPSGEAGFGRALAVILGFGVALIAIFSALLVGVVLGWRALRHREHRTWPNLVLVGLSILGVVAQAFSVHRRGGVVALIMIRCAVLEAFARHQRLGRGGTR